MKALGGINSSQSNKTEAGASETPPQTDKNKGGLHAAAENKDNGGAPRDNAAAAVIERHEKIAAKLRNKRG